MRYQRPGIELYYRVKRVLTVPSARRNNGAGGPWERASMPWRPQPLTPPHPTACCRSAHGPCCAHRTVPL